MFGEIAQHERSFKPWIRNMSLLTVPRGNSLHLPMYSYAQTDALESKEAPNLCTTSLTRPTQRLNRMLHG